MWTSTKNTISYDEAKSNAKNASKNIKMVRLSFFSICKLKNKRPFKIDLSNYSPDLINRLFSLANPPQIKLSLNKRFQY